MTTANLCKCNNCGTILIDQNPQIGAPELEASGAADMQYITDSNRENGYWACPICNTDDYLYEI